LAANANIDYFYNIIKIIDSGNRNIMEIDRRFLTAIDALISYPILKIEPEEQCSPEGYSWYSDHLITNRPSRYTQEQQLAILDSHPFFTGVCPSCGHEFERQNQPKVHWDCPECGWVDDSV
jgi:predicted RNA-binding Zn-ribbon protein involved in translation (DUF1610 family)